MSRRPRAACVFIVRDGYVAGVLHIVRRRFEVPGGKANKGERAAACAVRECREEVGVVPRGLRRLFVAVSGGHDCTVFAATISPYATLRGSREGEARWFTPAELVKHGTFAGVNVRALRLLGLLPKT